MADKEKYYMFVDECGDQNLSALDENFPVNFAYDIVKNNIYVSDGKKLGLKVIPRPEKGV